MSIVLSTTPTRTCLRPATLADEEFLLGLYTSTRADLAVLPAELRVGLVRQQYVAQDAHYRQSNPDASFDVVEVDGRPAGRLYVDRRADDVRVIDISLLPEHRGDGIGTALIRAVQDEAAAAGRSVSLHVALGNRAGRLYERLGFRLAADLGFDRLLEWRAP